MAHGRTGVHGVAGLRNTAGATAAKSAQAVLYAGSGRAGPLRATSPPGPARITPPRPREEVITRDGRASRPRRPRRPHFSPSLLRFRFRLRAVPLGRGCAQTGAQGATPTPITHPPARATHSTHRSTLCTPLYSALRWKRRCLVPAFPPACPPAVQHRKRMPLRSWPVQIAFANCPSSCPAII